MLVKFAVVGNPITHSKSPKLHNVFGNEFNLSLSYDKIDTSVKELARRTDELIASGYTGFNVTVPLKEEMFRIGVKRNYTLSKRSVRAKSVNTVSIKENNVILDNTDGVGFVKSISNVSRYSLSDKNILLIGAGGAARGILGPILDASPASITISNRSSQKLNILERDFDSHLLNFFTLDDLKKKAVCTHSPSKVMFDVIVNATSVSVLSKDSLIDSRFFNKATLVIDLFYSKDPTGFLKTAKECGCLSIMDGFPMLVEQAAESFYIWTGFNPDTSKIHSNRDNYFL